MLISRVVFIDSRVTNREALIAALGPETQWFVIDSESDGVSQMLLALASLGLEASLSSIHIVSHGASGQLQLGSTTLDAASLDAQAASLEALGNYLSEQADLLLYGCDVAAGEAGQAFIDQLAALTGADVAASSDLTGLGGDWELEASTGGIEAQTLQAGNEVGALSRIDGTDAGDTLVGDGLNNTILGGLGNDSIDAGLGSDEVFGGDGADTIEGNFGNDTLYGELGDDRLSDLQGDNLLDGGAGNDRLTAQDLMGNHTLLGGLGADTLEGTGQTVLLDGGDQNDRIIINGYLSAANAYVQNGSGIVFGAAGADSLESFSYSNATLDGGEGNDYIYATGGGRFSTIGLTNTTIIGGLGDDFLYSYEFSYSSIDGGDGVDNIRVGNSRSANITGGTGNDILNVGFDYWYTYYTNGSNKAGREYLLDGGGDNDSLTISTNENPINYGLTLATLLGGDGSDTLSVIDRAAGDTGNNGGSYGIARVSLDGGDGNDRLSAQGVLQATLSGGTGSDTFVLTAQQYRTQLEGTRVFQQDNLTGGGFSNISVSADPLTITDFQAGAGGDVLDLLDLLRNGTTGFDGANPFGPSGYLRLIASTVDPADTLLQFDANGGGDGFLTVAVLKNVQPSALVGDNFSPAYPTDGNPMPGLLIEGTAVAETIQGTAGGDTIYGFAGNDSIDGDAGFDSIFGGDGADTIEGSFGNDTLYGELGDDRLSDLQGDNLLDGGAGNDRLTAQDLMGNHTLLGGLGADTLEGTGQTVLLDGGDQNDRIIINGYLSAANAYVQNGSGIVFGAAGADSLESFSYSNATLDGGEGNDYIYATGGGRFSTIGLTNTTIIGGLGDDFLYSYEFSYSSIDGGDGVDNIRVGNSRSANITGGTGNDILNVGFDYWYTYYTNGSNKAGREYLLDGGGDNDSLTISTNENPINYGLTLATLLGGDGSDTLSVIDRAAGDTGNNGGSYGIARVSLDGGDGNDRLSAQGVLQATLSGGTGSDTFVLTAQQYRTQLEGTRVFQQDNLTGGGFSNISVSADPLTITDFQAGAGGDVLDLLDLLRNGTTGFDGANPFGPSGYLRLIASTVDPADTLLQFDANGGGDGFLTVAVLKNVQPSALVGDNFSPAYPTDGNPMPGLLIEGTAVAETIQGTAGGDTIYGFAGNDSIDGDAGFDSIFGGDGADTIEGSFGNDTLYGELGDDRLSDLQGDNLLDGGAGNDRLTAQDLMGNHTLLGGLGADTLEGTGQTVLLDGGDQNDRIIINGYLSAANAYVQNGSGIVFGAAGADSLESFSYSNATLDGGEGNDYIYATGGGRFSTIGLTNTTIIGGLGDDFLYSYEFSYSSIDGGDGVDNIRVGNSRSANITGGTGNDILNVGFDYWYTYYTNGSNKAGREYLLDGGGDNDSLTISTNENPINYGLTLATLLGGDGSDTLSVIDRAAGDTGNNGGSYGIARVSLDGGDGNDRLSAQGVLQATLSGGTGSDTFVLTAQQYRTQLEGTRVFQQDNLTGGGFSNISVSADPLTITDFQAGRTGSDILEITDILRFGATNYDGSNPFKTGHIDIEQSGDDTLLKFDANGGADSYVTLAVLKGVTSTELVSKNFSPVVGTPNGDVMSGLSGGAPIEGWKGKDVMLAINVPEDETTWINDIETLVANTPSPVEDNIFDGGEGDDIMAGGNGSDTYIVDNVDDKVIEVSNQGNADKVVTSVDFVLPNQVEQLEVAATAAANTKGTGNAQDNVMRANDAGNELDGGEGNDQLLGGGGNDRLLGGVGKDKLTGGSGNDVVEAGDGDDEIVGGDGAGDDTYLGGEGVDLVRYTSAVTGITVNLAAGTANGNEIGTDSLSGIENLIGGQAGDLLTGSAEANDIDAFTGNDTLDGGDGNDTLTGAAGDDAVQGGAGDDVMAASAGDDVLEGGEGSDTVTFAGSFSDYSISWKASTATLTVSSAAEGSDAIRGVETFRFADGDYAASLFQNSVPTLTSVAPLAGAAEDTAYTITYEALAAAADEADEEGDSLSFQVEGVSSGTLTKDGVVVTAGATTLSSGEALVWTPAANAAGTISAFTVKVSDGRLLSSSAVQVQIEVATVNDAPTGSVTIARAADATGALSQGETLTASNSLADVDGIPDSGAGAIAYQWLADGVVISGATGSTFALTQAEVGKAISVTASYTDNQGTVESVTSTPTAAVANVNDAPTGEVLTSRAAEATGSLSQGETLTASNTLADVDGIPDSGSGAIAYQWLADGVAIIGATGSTLALGQDEVGKAIAVTASYTDEFGAEESVTSAATAAVANVNDYPTGSVSISRAAEATGALSQGETLTASNTLADVDGIPTSGSGAIAYQWLADGVAIIGATGSTLALGQDEVGKAISVTASYTDELGAEESLTSAATAAVANVNDAPTGEVTISRAAEATGALSQGETLTASNTLADVDGIPDSGSGAVTYQWLADGVAITGATGSTLTLGQYEVGKAISVTASYTDNQGRAESVTSAPTLAVANVDDEATATLTVTGAASEGGSLTASLVALTDADGSTSTTWRWELNAGTAESPVWAPIAGADLATFAIPGDESYVGKSVRVVATTADALGGTTEFASAAQAINGVNDAPEGTVTISGNALTGSTLTATNNLSDPDGMGSVSYQWKADGAVIVGATDATFTLTQAEVGKEMTVTASYVDQGGTAESVTSAATTAVVDPNRAPTAVADFAGVAKNSSTSIAVLANDSDVDGNALTVLSVTQPTVGGTVSIQNNAVLFTPTSSTWTGTTSFSYTVKDTGNLTAVATVTVVVGTALNGSDAANILNGTTGIDVIRGNGGNDTISANAAGDVVYGGLGNDTLYGGAGADTLFGEAGSDIFRVGSSELTGDVISGGDDIDTLAFTSNVTLTGGFTLTGVETLNMGGRSLAVQTTVHIDLSAMNLVSRGAINGDSQANRITGTRDADSMNGSTGNDNLAGSGGNDTLYGGTGADTIRGGLGNDTLYGGSSSKADTAADTFVFDTAPDSATNWDTIIGFEATARDKIALDVQNIFTAIRLNGTTGLDADEFRSNATGNAEDANDYLIFDTTTGNLWYDPDGSGATAKKLIAKITLANGTLDPSDFTTTPPPGP